MNVSAAHHAIFARTALALDATAHRYPSDTFATWTAGDNCAVRASAPELGFLSTLTIPAPISADELGRQLTDERWRGESPVVVFTVPPDAERDALSDLGYLPADPRPLAIRQLAEAPGPAQIQVQPVADADLDQALDVLVRGYAASSAVAHLIEDEHRHPSVRLLAATDSGRMIAVAAWSRHGEVAVLGGAGTLPSDRGKGAQTALLQERLRLAHAEGCTLAVATAAPNSPSVRNLARAGFGVIERPASARRIRRVENR